MPKMLEWLGPPLNSGMSEIVLILNHSVVVHVSTLSISLFFIRKVHILVWSEGEETLLLGVILSILIAYMNQRG